MESDRFCDYQEYMRREFREFFAAITVWQRGKGGEEATKVLLKKNKKRLREGLKPSMESKLESLPAIESLAAKHERKEYLDTMRRLEHLYGRLCRTLYTPDTRDLHRFLRNAHDFGFNYDLKSEDVLKEGHSESTENIENTENSDLSDNDDD